MKSVHKFCLICGLLCIQFLSLVAGDLPLTNNTDSTRKVKYIGAQGNQLLRQFLSFNNNNLNTNPFLFSFSVANKKGYGFSMGTGMNFSVESSTDGVSFNEVTTRNFAFRIGVERKFYLSEKWIPFGGVDMHFGGNYSKIFTQQFQSIGVNSTTNTTTNLFLGPALRGGVLFALSKHFLLGTEGYFNFKISYQETTSSSDFLNGNGFAPGKGGGRTGFPVNVGITVPTALFLIAKF